MYVCGDVADELAEASESKEDLVIKNAGIEAGDFWRELGCAAGPGSSLETQAKGTRQRKAW